MKLHTNLLSYFFLAALFIFSSCQDEEEEPSRRDMLIGTWEIQSGELADYSATTEFGVITRDNIQTIALVLPEAGEIAEAMEEGADVLFPSGTVITFNEDNSFALNDQEGVTNGTWALSDDEKTITVQAPNDLGSNQLDFSIASLTEQQIDIALQIDENDVNLENFGVENLPLEIESFTIDYNFSFIKQ